MSDMRYAASLMVDRAETVQPSATAVLKAMRACTILSNHGVWIDPPARVVHYAGVGDPSVVNVPINVSASVTTGSESRARSPSTSARRRHKQD